MVKYILIINISINCIYVWIIANMIRACMLMKILLIIVLNTEKIGIRYCSK